MSDAATDHDDRLERYERDFRRAGLPLLTEDYALDTDVFNRAAPLLLIVLVLELVSALDVDWPWLANVGAVAAALAATLGALALANRARGRRALAMPDDVGWVELAIFVLAPSVVHFVFHGGYGAGVLAANVALLALVALGYGFGLGSIVVWAGKRLTGQLAASLLLLAKAIPLLLIFAIVLFVNTEMWQVFSGRSDATLIAMGALLAFVATAFLAARLPREVARLERGASAGVDAPPLRRAQRLNVALVLLISHGLQIAVVTIAIGAFFVAFGMIAIDADVIESWTGTRGDELLSVTLLDVPLLLTTELLRVSAAIAALSGLYYAIAVLTDDAYREEFLDEVTSQMRATFAARAEYLALRADRPAR